MLLLVSNRCFMLKGKIFLPVNASVVVVILNQIAYLVLVAMVVLQLLADRMQRYSAHIRGKGRNGDEIAVTGR